ncbi:DUF3048 domain-containing protein [Abyssisolibacter fermentans]|uniref:DUF3048 domain-containing protein n=1 Tax=Abyssisolibacter fermentans TaxID=1766203 RepID=UPI00083386F5|nr:DUF3048 domain-containing protein [Abyssisolibacter fermentans]
MKKILCLMLVLFLMISVVGCDDNKTTTKDVVSNIPNDENINSEQNNEDEQQNTDSQNNEEPDELVVEGIMSPLSGNYAPEEKVNRRPVAVMLDNHRAARWQAGVSEAEIIYEILAEGRITRYLAIFLVNDPKMIGPVRSARPYFINAALEYDPLYVRCGGSEQAKKDVKNLNMADIDGLYSGSFWRYYDTGKKAEHTLYTSMEKIRKEQQRKGYRMTGKYIPFKFNEEDTDIIRDDVFNANEVFIDYKMKNTTKYVYDEVSKTYKRYKDGKLHVDENDNKTIIAKNIFVQLANTKIIDSYGRRSIDTIGKGTGYYITNGKGIKITWSKKDRSSKTKYYDADNNEIQLNPGVTWIQVVEAKPIVKFK